MGELGELGQLPNYIGHTLDNRVIYTKERNCLGDKSLRFSRIFAKFAKLNPRGKKIFFRFSELAKL